MKASEFSFKKGLYQLNPQPNFNFQLNRVIMWDGGRLEEFLCVYLYTEKSPPSDILIPGKGRSDYDFNVS